MTELEFITDHWYLEDLPGDPDDENVRRQVNGAAWSRVAPTPTADPALIAHSAEIATELGISATVVASQQFTRAFSGNEVPADMMPFAMTYGGHQFGNWAGQLGDGRAIVLGEVTTPSGSHQVLQLKGAGPTPYSRGADGRAVLRSSIREFLCSEAMHHLGIPTTRALSLILTGDEVVRDMLYDGHPAPEPGAVVCRVAPGFVRFGHFELPASRGEVDLLRQLVEHTVQRYFPHLLVGKAGDGKAGMEPITDDVITAWFREVMERTADLMVGWMRVGFVHGVMNTDNLSILGLTI
ncbi:MAG: protein adenylyltransferase SelO family protein, partial [Ilumatobacter sp.]|nr:protein adenylyltransferase SelO family protein [Ilumatobacter sp.]